MQKNVIIVTGAIVILAGGWFVFDQKAAGEGEVNVMNEKTTNTGVATLQEQPVTENHLSGNIESGSIKTSEEADEQNPIIFVHAQWGYDPKDTKAVVENSTFIFIGRVTDRIQNRGVDADYTWPTFSVDILSTVKGNVSGKVEMAQTDLHYSNGRTFVMSGDIAWPKDVKEEDILLKEGATYVFAASYSEGKELYGVGLAPYDRELITMETGLSDEAALNLSKQNPRVQEFVQAAQELGVLNEDWNK